MNEQPVLNMISSARQSTSLRRAETDTIEGLDCELTRRFEDRLIVQKSLTRSLVSFQSNKGKPAYRWYKYKEAFSAPLLEYLFHHYKISGRILDPFAGSGTALFAASEAGMDAEGIELLPIGQQIISVRKLLESDFSRDDFLALERWVDTLPWKKSEQREPLPELRITKAAYSPETLVAIEKFMTAWRQENDRVQAVLRFALLCVLESVSYTRKDGQYLRWDYRSGRRQGQKQFDKGLIADFDRAIREKLSEIIADARMGEAQTELFPREKVRGAVHLRCGSCLDVMPSLPAESFDAVITSPPYCNRYDYTRTYALELALLGVGEQELINLRQQMLSCTVENRAKDLQRMNPAWSVAIKATDRQELLQAILKYLEEQKEQGELNNSGIPRMARGYFYEMACVIAECARVMKSGAPLIMVNDNVRYAGASVSVDLILSDLAEKLGFGVEHILVLPTGKGNSSQQMGEHGKEALRKCIYVWRKI
jgi:DNA modification methylase